MDGVQRQQRLSADLERLEGVEKKNRELEEEIASLQV